MAVQCNICLSHDTDTEWSILGVCGHVFHTVCIQQELEFRRRCPNCRVDIPKSRGSSLPFRKVFFELSDEPIGICEEKTEAAAENAAAGQLQMKLLLKDQQLQQLKISCTESDEKNRELEGKLCEAHISIRKLQEKRDKYIGELKDLGRRFHAATNEAANLRVQLHQAQMVESRYNLLTDATLEGQPLWNELKKLMDKDVHVPGWFKHMLEVRNKQISAETNRAQRAEMDKQQAVGHLKYEIDKLQREVSQLKQQLDERQRALDLEQAAPGPKGLEGRKRRLDLKQGNNTHITSHIMPAPRASATAGFKLSLRQRMEKLPSKDVRGIPGSSVIGTSSCAAALSPSSSLQIDNKAVKPHPPESQSAMEEEFVLLEESDEQVQEGDGFYHAADIGEVSTEEDDRGDPCSFSEVDTEDELDILDADAFTKRQLQPAEMHRNGNELSAPRLDGGALLFKPPTGWGSRAKVQGSRIRRQDSKQNPNELQPSSIKGTPATSLLPAKAGPSRGGAGAGAGPTFLRDPENANTGFDDQAKYIHRGPDGRGGTVSVFKTGDLHTKAIQQSHVRAACVQGAAVSRKCKVSRKTATSRPAANGGCTIDLFFNKRS